MWSNPWDYDTLRIPPFLYPIPSVEFSCIKHFDIHYDSSSNITPRWSTNYLSERSGYSAVDSYLG